MESVVSHPLLLPEVKKGRLQTQHEGLSFGLEQELSHAIPTSAATSSPSVVRYMTVQARANPHRRTTAPRVRMVLLCGCKGKGRSKGLRAGRV